MIFSGSGMQELLHSNPIESGNYTTQIESEKVSLNECQLQRWYIGFHYISNGIVYFTLMTREECS